MKIRRAAEQAIKERQEQEAAERREASGRAMASEIRDDSDRSSLATYFHLFVREVQEQTAVVLAGRAADANSDPM